LLGCCDVIIATKNSIIGMGGPAMIEGGGLGIFAPDEVAPLDVQVPNGVIDIVVEDEAEAVEVAKKYLSYFQGPTKEWEAPDQRVMRHIVPENRKRMYDMRDIIDTLADVGSVLEIRKEFGIGMITAFIRVEGKPLGLIANNPHHLAGAIDSDGADKGARFLQLCDAFDMPIVSLMDCPGIMVGPEVEKTALVRHCCRMFNTGANLSVPMFGLIIRKAYGLGVQAMCGGSSMVPLFTSAWPTAEFAGMNIEGSIKLAYRNDFAAMEDAEERIADFNRKVDAAYDRAKAVNSAEFYGIDDVIDPADSRAMVVAGLRSLPPVLPRNGKKRPYIDTW
jgi:acetyl-CoA carboxylase carboxyltransferase component